MVLVTFGSKSNREKDGNQRYGKHTCLIMYALIDCNNFFVSCERLFRPELSGRPVVVLSSNDGCAVSRSQEAKDLGVPMGAPHFQWREFFKQHGVSVFSANFELYGDISERITNLLASVTPHIEVYSVDESFLDLHELTIPEYTLWGREVRASILQHTGIPVSIGIAPTKTLAKLATGVAKKWNEERRTKNVEGSTSFAVHRSSFGTPGVLSLAEQPQESVTRILHTTPVQDVWGVGWRLAPKLRAAGVHTALDLQALDPRYARQLMGLHGRQMVAELNGTPCLPFAPHSKPQQMVLRGRQFGEDTSEPYVIEAAIASLGTRAAAALRRERQLARRAVVTLQTNRHKPGYQRIGRQVRFYTPTADTGVIISQLTRLLQAELPPLQYHKAEVLLYDLVARNSLQTDVFGMVDLDLDTRSQRKMQAVDALNLAYGKGTIHMAAEALSRAWEPRKNLSSPRYTSDWADVPEVKLVQ